MSDYDYDEFPSHMHETLSTLKTSLEKHDISEEELKICGGKFVSTFNFKTSKIEKSVKICIWIQCPRFFSK